MDQSAAEAEAIRAGQTVVIGQDVSSMLVTAPDFEGDPPGLTVEWIDWASGFRASGLKVGDRIVAVDGQPVARPATPEEAQRVVPRMVGQPVEHQAWAEAGRKDGDHVRLTVRRMAPPRGWQTLELTGLIRAQRTWSDANGRRLFGPLGPDQMASDGFPESWTGWYDKAVAGWTRAVAWERQGMVVSGADFDVERTEARVRKLTELYRGPFADGMAADWALVVELLAGREYQLADGILDYRTLGEQRAQEIAEAGRSARDAFRAANAGELIPAFPSIDPVLGDRAAVTGKLTELPRVTPREWISQGDRTVFVFAKGNECYVADGDGPEIAGMIRAERRYASLVTPNIQSEYEIVGRILPDPTMVVVQERGMFALRVEPVAATVGGALFVDLSTGAEASPFAGEETLAGKHIDPPADSADAATVLAAFFGAMKYADRALWRSLYADWWVYFANNGLPVLSTGRVVNEGTSWDLARRRIMTDVVDVRIRWADDPVTIVRSDAFEGAPSIEQTVVVVDHLRQTEQTGAARSFMAVGLTRRWILQRWNGGPWRVVTDAGI